MYKWLLPQLAVHLDLLWLLTGRLSDLGRRIHARSMGPFPVPLVVRNRSFLFGSSVDSVAPLIGFSLHRTKARFECEVPITLFSGDPPALDARAIKIL